MQKPQQPKSEIKARFRDAVVARKKADTTSAKSRGADLLATIRKHAVKDLEALEAVFIVTGVVQGSMQMLHVSGVLPRTGLQWPAFCATATDVL